MNAQHTPGPWAVHDGSEGPEVHAKGSDGGQIIADVSPEWTGEEVAEANARLIAQAPAMEDILKQVGMWAEVLDKYLKGKKWSGLVRMLYEARKITGTE